MTATDVPAPRTDGTEAAALVRWLYREYGPALVRYCGELLGGDSHAAEDIVQETLLDDGLLTVDHSEQTLTAVEVTRALAALSPAHRQVVEEFYFRGRTAAETAALLGIPVGTAKTRIYYALRTLRQVLAQRGLTGRLATTDLRPM